MKPVSDAVKEKIENNIFSRKELMIIVQELKADSPAHKINQSVLHRKLCRAAWKAFRESHFAFSGIMFLKIPFWTSPNARSLGWGVITFAVVLQICLSIYISASLKDKSVCTQFKLVKLAYGLIFAIGR